MTENEYDYKIHFLVEGNDMDFIITLKGDVNELRSVLNDIHAFYTRTIPSSSIYNYGKWDYYPNDKHNFVLRRNHRTTGYDIIKITKGSY